MKLVVFFTVMIVALASHAGRPTPKGDSMAQINTVMQTVQLGDRVLAVDLVDEKKSLYIVEFERNGKCHAMGYLVHLVSRDPRTAAPTFSATHDGLRRICQ